MPWQGCSGGKVESMTGRGRRSVRLGGAYRGGKQPGSTSVKSRLRRFARACVVGMCLVAGMPCLAQSTQSISVDDLRAPERAMQIVSSGQQDAYRKVMQAYAQQEVAHPDDTALFVAQCQFVENLVDSDSDDFSEGVDAQADYEACKKTLAARFPSDPEVSLYVAEHRYGNAAVDFAITLVQVSAHWTPQQQSRLHVVLSRGYTATNRADLAGQEALASVRLDPGSSQLVAALRYLCDGGHRIEAESLLAKIPLARYPWMEIQRVHFAADNLSPAVALAELQRAESVSKNMDPWLAARIYLRAGMNAKAADALSKIKIEPASQTIAQYQLRVNVAAAQGDGKAASAALRDWFDKTGVTQPLLSAYVMLLAHDPWQLFSSPLMPLAWATLAVLAFLAYLPGMIAFPAHYRGMVRARLHKATQPLFASIGLRHMWLALGGCLLTSTLVPMLSAGSALRALAANQPMSAGEEVTALVVQLTMLVCGGLFLFPVIRRLSWRVWLGDRGLKAALITVLAVAAFKALAFWGLSHSAHFGAMLRSTPHDQKVATLTTIAAHVGGAGLAMLIVAILMPIYEELVFRGAVLGGLTRHISFGWANVWQSLLFALIHFDLKHFIFYFLLGALGGWLVQRTRGLAASTALHAANNAIACVGILLSG